MPDYNRYQPFPPSPEVVTVDDVDKLKGVSENTQKNVFSLKDTDFLDRVLFVLQNHPLTNSVWVDLMDTNEKVDLGKSTDVAFSAPEKGYVFDPASLALTATLESVTYQVPNASPVQQVMLMAIALTPEGTSIAYEVSNDGATFYPVTVSTGSLISLPAAGGALRLRARFSRTTTSVTPRLDSWALIYVDLGVAALSIDRGESLPPTDPTAQEPEALLLPHSHDGTDGWGLVSHRSLLGIGPDDHHPKLHRHSGEVGENAQIELGTETRGIIPLEQIPVDVVLASPGGEIITSDAEGRIVKVVGQNGGQYAWYYSDGRLDYSITIHGSQAMKEIMQYDSNLNPSGRTIQIYPKSDPVIQGAILTR